MCDPSVQLSHLASHSRPRHRQQEGGEQPHTDHGRRVHHRRGVRGGLHPGAGVSGAALGVGIQLLLAGWYSVLGGSIFHVVFISNHPHNSNVYRRELLLSRSLSRCIKIYRKWHCFVVMYRFFFSMVLAVQSYPVHTVFIQGWRPARASSLYTHTRPLPSTLSPSNVPPIITTTSSKSCA